MEEKIGCVSLLGELCNKLRERVCRLKMSQESGRLEVVKRKSLTAVTKEHTFDLLEVF